MGESNGPNMGGVFLLLGLMSIQIWAAQAHESNYGVRGVDVEYQGTGLPQEATLDGKVTLLDSLPSIITTNRTKATLGCASRAMEVDLDFTEPFNGIVYAEFNRHSACSFTGNGQTKYHFELPLSGCGTIQDPLRVFTNNIIVRFHPGLELEGDEVKTIVCRYPPPVVPPPIVPVPPLPKETVNEASVNPVPTDQFQPLIIFCALLFLALMLLGVACSYVCVKKRNIKLIRRRRALSSGTGSVITKLSGSTFPQLPMFDGLKIPRAHATSSSGSEAALVGGRISNGEAPDIPSDYPSESRSSSEMEVGERQMRMHAGARSPVHEIPYTFENRAYVHAEDDSASAYSDAHAQRDFDMIAATTMARVEPTFDVNIKVHKKRSLPPPSVASSSDSEAEVRLDMMRAQERTLTTILEREEGRSNELESSAHAQYSMNPALNGPALPMVPPPPTYAKTKKKQRSRAPSAVAARSEASYALSQHSIPENDTYSIGEHVDIPDGRAYVPYVSHPRPPESIASLNTEMTDTHSVTETMVHNSRSFERPALMKSEITPTLRNEVRLLFHPPPAPPSIPPSDYASEGRSVSEFQERNRTLNINEELILQSSTEKFVREEEEVETLIIPSPERRIPPPKTNSAVTNEYQSQSRDASNIFLAEKQIVPRKPNLTTHMVDDVYLSTIKETRTREDEERVRREIIEFHKRAKMAALPPPDWDVTIRTYPDEHIEYRSPDWDQLSDTTVASRRSRLSSIIPPPTVNPPPNWDVLIRVLDPPQEVEIEDDDDDAMSVLTVEDREKWYQIITTENSLRSLLTEAVVREDFERIRHDQRYEKVFEPPKWDVIIRVLAPPNQPDDFSDIRSETTTYSEPVVRRYRKRNDDMRSQRSSNLAPLHEVDTSTTRTTNMTTTMTSEQVEWQRRYGRGPGSTVSGKTGPTSEYDLRSITESVVNFAKREPDTWSESSGYTLRSSNYPRSMADRSHSEFVEIVPYERRVLYEGDDSDGESATRSVGGPSLARSASEFTEHWTTQRVPFDRMSSASGYSYTSSRRPDLERATTEIEEDVPQRSSSHDDLATSPEASPVQSRRKASQ